MSVSESDFFEYASASDADDQQWAAKDLILGRLMVETLIEENAWPDSDIRQELIDQAILDTGNALFMRRRTIGAPPQYNDFGKELPQPANMRDPLAIARVLLAPHLKAAFA